MNKLWHNGKIQQKKRNRKQGALSMKAEIKNPELDLAYDFVEKTDRSIFLTGKAGTGKTTFLHKIKAQSSKRMIVVAPTGVAAINAKGVTIHSFFQLPFGPIIPNQPEFQQRGNYKMRFGKLKINIIKSLDLLIIDEISMVRADLLDGIDKVLRRYKDSNKVFGGVQVLMIGDLHQLSPVVNPNEWSLLESYYETAYFFSSHSFQQANTIGIELLHIYRQDNQEFINILNEIRNNKLSQLSATRLNERYLPNFVAQENEGYITLTTHNNRAGKMNNIELAKINNESHFYEAEIKGTFNEQAYPTFDHLELKLGAQVMFIKNDSSTDKRYFNGKIGKITKLNKSEITVKCPEDDSEIIVTQEVWENIKYAINQDSKEITENVAGSFSQMPLRLAWAITIHKSQGLTFDKAIIDAEASFAHGQTYVALSRCRTLEGIVLKNEINSSSIITDQQVLSYVNDVKDNPPNESDLTQSQIQFQLRLISELFDYTDFIIPIKSCMKVYYQNRNSIKGSLLNELVTILDEGVNPLIRINAKFSRQLIDLVNTNELPENNPLIQQRIQKALSYFLQQTNQLINTPLEQLTFSTDNKDTKKNIEKHLHTIEEVLEQKLSCLNGISQGFNSKDYLKLKAESLLENLKPEKNKKEYKDTTEHPQLFEKLREMRLSIAQADDIAAFQIFTQQTLYEMCEYFPINEKQLKAINGMGKVRVEKYADKILTIITEYVEKNQLVPREAKSKTTNPKKGESQAQSFELYKQGMKIEEISKQRGFVVSTIESHLSYYIKTGEIEITALISKEKYQTLKKLIQNTEFEGLNDLKNQLGENYSYGDIRMAMMAIEFEVDRDAK